MMLLLDNYDSFTYNLADYIMQCGMPCRVLRNDTPMHQITDSAYTGVVLSPGPATPQKAGNLMAVLAHYEQQLPILGVCLGHQAIGQYYGATLQKAIKPMHGKLSDITVTQPDELFTHLPARYQVVRYHSLVIGHMRKPLQATAYTDEGEIMALKHHSLPIRGVQFHPEAILTQYGLQLIQNWVNFCRQNR